jgi:hypothetical protein
MVGIFDYRNYFSVIISIDKILLKNYYTNKLDIY